MSLFQLRCRTANSCLLVMVRRNSMDTNQEQWPETARNGPKKMECEESCRSGVSGYQLYLKRLSRASCNKHFDALDDVPWVEYETSLSSEHPSWELSAFDSSDVLASSDWYLGQPATVRREIGLHTVVHRLSMGVAFESILVRGLLQFCRRPDVSAEEQEYIAHEIAEEAQHIMMFGRFITLSRKRVYPMHRALAAMAERAVWLSKVFPELFFLYVLAGEVPIDHLQRLVLRSPNAHPLLKRIMHIHVTEEARHISFAENFLRMRVPHLSLLKRLWFRWEAPVALRVIHDQMIYRCREIEDCYGTPQPLRAAFARNSTKPQIQVRSERVARIKALCEELGLISSKESFWIRVGLEPAA